MRRLRWRLGRLMLDVKCLVVTHDWTPPGWCPASPAGTCRYCRRCGRTQHDGTIL